MKEKNVNKFETKHPLLEAAFLTTCNVILKFICVKKLHEKIEQLSYWVHHECLVIGKLVIAF